MNELDRCRQMLWECSSIDPQKTDPHELFLGLRAYLYTQALFQQQMSWGFLRWPALISKLEKHDPIHQQFHDALGVTPDEFMILCYGIYIPALNKKNQFKREFLSSLRPLLGKSIDIFLNKFSRNFTDLRSELRDELDAKLYDIRNGQRVPKNDAEPRNRLELVEFPWLAKYPFLQTSPNSFIIWHPIVLARGIEQAVHRYLSEFGQKYTDRFSKVFEDYVISLVRETGLRVITDTEFKKMGNRSFPAVDAILDLDGVNIFIEAKMSIFTDDVLLRDEPPIVFRKLRRIREAIAQGWRVGSILRNGKINIGASADAKQDFLIIVTSRQLLCCTGEHLKLMLWDNVFNNINPEAQFGAPTEEQMNCLPPKNILIISIEEFEHLIGCIQNNEINILEILKKTAIENEVPSTMSLTFGQILEKEVTRWYMPQVMTDARNRIEGQLQSVLIKN